MTDPIPAEDRIMDEQYLVEMRGISKSFGGVHALKDVSLLIRKGKVHALMGENGAGKSTLMKILLGFHQPDEGKIIFEGNEITLKSPGEALDKGFSMVSQELMQMDEMTVADNMFMGRYSGKFKIDKKTLYDNTAEIFRKLGIEHIRPNAKIRSLSLAQRQLVEIAKAVSYNAKLIVMDEPTSALMDAERDILFRIIRDLKAEGTAIIYISHKMEEIFQIADEVTVLRDGTYIGHDEASNLDNDRLIQMMVGRKLTDLYVRSESKPGDVALEVKNLSSGTVFHDVSFQVRHGEVLGFAGLMGAGRSEIMETIFGIRKKTSGTILKDGKEIEIRNPKDAIKNKIAFLTEDRKGTGLFLNMPIAFNSSISSLDLMNNGWTVSRKKESAKVEKMSDELKLKRSSINAKVSSLSGGNQQKVVLCKWMLTEPDVLILDEPTRGIDVGAKKEIYTLIDSIAKSGKAVIIISSEMPEVIGISDRILVMYEGRLKGQLNRGEVTQEGIMAMMTK